MSLLEDLKNTDDWSIRYGLWDKLFVGHTLFQELSELDPAKVDDAVATLEQIHASAQEGDQPSEWEWNTALSLITCAQVAVLREKTPERLEQILSRLNPQFQVLGNIDSSWSNGVKESIYQLAWPNPLSAEWAWDAVSSFNKTPRKVLRTTKITILLLEKSLGITADLVLALIEEGQGMLYPDPETMSFVRCGEEFLQAGQHAVAFIRERGLWPKTKDVRWMITRRGQEPMLEIHGGSAGGAFALGLAKLLANDE